MIRKPNFCQKSTQRPRTTQPGHPFSGLSVSCRRRDFLVGWKWSRHFMPTSLTASTISRAVTEAFSIMLGSISRLVSFVSGLSNNILKLNTFQLWIVSTISFTLIIKVDTCAIPFSAYTQVATLAVYSYLFSAVLAKQFLEPRGSSLDSQTFKAINVTSSEKTSFYSHTPVVYVPIFSILVRLSSYHWM